MMAMLTVYMLNAKLENLSLFSFVLMVCVSFCHKNRFSSDIKWIFSENS